MPNSFIRLGQISNLDAMNIGTLVPSLLSKKTWSSSNIDVSRPSITVFLNSCNKNSKFTFKHFLTFADYKPMKTIFYTWLKTVLRIRYSCRIVFENAQCYLSPYLKWVNKTIHIEQSKFAYGGSIIGSSQFTLMPQLPLFKSGPKLTRK